MNGPQHYAESERLLAESKQKGIGFEYSRALVELAHTHATLAGAAAIALQIIAVYGGHHQQIDEWATALTTEKGNQ